MELDKKIFNGKTLGDLVQEAYENKKKRETDIELEIQRLSGFISTVGEAIAISPLIKPLIDANLKNDEVLIKILDLFRKSSVDANTAADSILSPKDLEQLMMDIPTSNKQNDTKLLE